MLSWLIVLGWLWKSTYPASCCLGTSRLRWLIIARSRLTQLDWAHISKDKHLAAESIWFRLIRWLCGRFGKARWKASAIWKKVPSRTAVTPSKFPIRSECLSREQFYYWNWLGRQFCTLAVFMYNNYLNARHGFHDSYGTGSRWKMVNWSSILQWLSIILNIARWRWLIGEVEGFYYANVY